MRCSFTGVFSEAKWPADTLLLASTLIIFLSLVVLEQVVRITKGPREERHGSRRRKNAVAQVRQVSRIFEIKMLRTRVLAVGSWVRCPASARAVLFESRERSAKHRGGVGDDRRGCAARGACTGGRKAADRGRDSHHVYGFHRAGLSAGPRLARRDSVRAHTT